MADEKQEQQTPKPKKRKRRRRHPILAFFKYLFLTLFTCVLIACLTTAAIAKIFLRYAETAIVPVVEVRAEDYTMKMSSVVYYEQDGKWVELQKVHGLENRIWVDFDQMPDQLWQAAVAIEDERYFSHHGVDWKRTASAVVNMFLGMKDTFGASTITQQTLRNMTDDRETTVNRKLREIFRALEFEKNYTKEQILELYLNMIYLDQGCYGVQTAAEYYFGKDVSELTAAECASLIAITNNPSLYGPMYKVSYTRKDGSKITPRELNKERQLNVLAKMHEVCDPATGEPYLSDEEYEAARKEPLKFMDSSGATAEDIVAAHQTNIEINNWFTDQLIRDVAQDLAAARQVSVDAAHTMLNNGGYQIFSTMDMRIQTIAESVYRERENLDITSPKGEAIQSGITIMDPYTGKIVAMVGQMEPKTANFLSNYATEKHQVGSAIKPLAVYSAALELGAITPAQTFDNYPVRLMNDKPWPTNSPAKYTGRTMIPVGIQDSINTISVQTLEKLGPEASFMYATENLNLGLVAQDMDVSPLALGGLTYGLSTREMCAAYCTFPNGGVYNTPRMYTEVRDANGNVVLKNDGESHVAMKEVTAGLMNGMLQNVIKYGTGKNARLDGMTVAGKTGTTDSKRTRYFVGYTPYYCAAVWTGYPKTNEKIEDGGKNPALKLWKLVMEPVHEGLEDRPLFAPDSGLETVSVCMDSGLLCTDACLSDRRGSRAVNVTVQKGMAPVESCGLHVFATCCTEGHCLATDACIAAGTTLQAGVLSLDRVDYFMENGTRVIAEDEPYTLVGMQRAIGMAPYPRADGSIDWAETIGCPAHGGVSLPPDYDPNDPNAPLGPEDPANPYDPSNPYYPWPEDPTDPYDPAHPYDPNDPQGPAGPYDPPVEPRPPVEPEGPEDPFAPLPVDPWVDDGTGW